MVISGAVNAGKTEFIKAISEIEVVSTERRATDDTKLIKKETTVAMDFGRIAIADDLVLHLFGTPGQKRFDFMWEILSEGMLGLVILVDSTRPETFRETNRIIDFFVSYRDTPYVVAANKQDKPNAWAPDELRLALGLPPIGRAALIAAETLKDMFQLIIRNARTIILDLDNDLAAKRVLGISW